MINNDNVVVNHNQQGGNSTNAIIINQLSEKLIEQYEERLKELKETNARLMLTINELKNLIKDKKSEDN